MALRNLALCLPELTSEERLGLARAHFESLGMGLIEMGMSWWASDARLHGRLHIEGLEHLEQAQAKGRGVLLVSAHFTSIDISGRLFAPRVPPMHVVYRRHQNPVLDFLMRRARKHIFAGAIVREDVRTLIRTLRRKGIVWYAPDQAYRGKYSAPVPFFGVPAPTNTATSRIARLTDAIVVPAFMERDAHAGVYTVRLLPMLAEFPSDDPVFDTGRINKHIETQIRRHPEQYFWVHRRFKKMHSSKGPDVY